MDQHIDWACFGSDNIIGISFTANLNWIHVSRRNTSRPKYHLFRWDQHQCLPWINILLPCCVCAGANRKLQCAFDLVFSSSMGVADTMWLAASEALTLTEVRASLSICNCNGHASFSNKCRQQLKNTIGLLQQQPPPTCKPSMYRRSKWMLCCSSRRCKLLGVRACM